MQDVQSSEAEFSPVCPFCGAIISDEHSVVQYRVHPVAGGMDYGGAEVIACRACHKVLGTR